MRMIGSMPSFRFSRSPGLTLVAFFVVLCAAYEAADLILEGDVGMLVMSGMAFVGLAIVVAVHAAVDEAQRNSLLLVICGLDVPTLKNVRLALQTLELLGLLEPAARIH